jgi:hypothetical protein
VNHPSFACAVLFASLWSLLRSSDHELDARQMASIRGQGICERPAYFNDTCYECLSNGNGGTVRCTEDWEHTVCEQYYEAEWHWIEFCSASTFLCPGYAREWRGLNPTCDFSVPYDDSDLCYRSFTVASAGPGPGNGTCGQ